MKIADSHTHLNQLPESVEKIIETSPEVGLFINIGTLLEDDFSHLTKFKEIYCSYGIHPNDYLKQDSQTMQYISKSEKQEHLYQILKEKIIRERKCVAIGETGLDFFYGKENNSQYDLLHLQLNLAKTLNKPVAIHARECNLKELINMIKSYGVKFVLHCYTYDLSNAMYAIENNGYISFSGILTFGQKVQELENTAKGLPSNRILIETDAPYLAPVPFRGKPNHPKYLKYTLKQLASLRRESEEETAEYTFQNTLAFYNIEDF